MSTLTPTRHAVSRMSQRGIGLDKMQSRTGDFEAMIAGIYDFFHSDALSEIGQRAPADDRHRGPVARLQSLQRSTAFHRHRGRARVYGYRRQSAVEIER